MTRDARSDYLKPQQLEHCATARTDRTMQRRKAKKNSSVASWQNLPEFYKVEVQKGSPVHRYIRCLVGLATVPPAMVPVLFDLYFRQGLIRYPDIPFDVQEKCLQVAKYYEEQWLNNSVITVDMWNHCYNRSHRTSNIAEGYHNKLRYTLKVNHPTLTAFFPAMQQLHLAQVIRIDQLLAGAIPKQKKLRYRKLNDKFWSSQDTLFRDLSIALKEGDVLNVGYNHLFRAQYLLQDNTRSRNELWSMEDENEIVFEYEYE